MINRLRTKDPESHQGTNAYTPIIAVWHNTIALLEYKAISFTCNTL